MESKELCKNLRRISNKNGSPFIKKMCKMGAQRIDKLSAELEKTKALLAAAVADLKEADVNCTYCSHKQPPAPCSQDDEHYTCEDCPHDCYCRDCDNNGKWEWQIF